MQLSSVFQHRCIPQAPTRTHTHPGRMSKRIPPAAAAAAASTTEPSPVLLQDGLVLPAPATAQQLLAQHRGWSYTAAVARQQYCLVDWELHMARLIRNLNVLAQQRPPAYASFMAWQQQQAGPEAVDSAMQQLINSVVAAALQQLWQQQQQPPSQDGQGRASVTVVLGDKALDQQPAAATAAASAPPLFVLVWAKQLPDAQQLTPAKVLAAGAPRAAAQAKHCDWVVARQPLEALKATAGVDEVVLCDERGALLEGLVSNMYVIADAAQLSAAGGGLDSATAAVAAGGSGPNDQEQQQQQQQLGMQQVNGLQQQLIDKQQQQQRGVIDGLVLLTTGPGSDALLGVTQQRVLQACQHIGLQVMLQPARLNTAAAWREAFLSNCLRGLQPVREVQSADGTPVWTAPEAAPVVLPLLQQQVQQLQTMTDMRQWLQQA